MMLEEDISGKFENRTNIKGNTAWNSHPIYMSIFHYQQLKH
jgi:hypothetical protein